jgi:hypothetical protein
MRRTPIKKRSRYPRLLLAALTFSVLLGYLTNSVFAAGITVNASVVYDKQHTILVRSELLPSQCSGLTITQVRNLTAGSTFGGSTNGQLWLGNAGQGTIINAGKNGDCVVPGGVPNGAGTDLTINGGNGGGADICFSGPGPGTYARNSCSSSPSYPYDSVTTNSPAFA